MKRPSIKLTVVALLGGLLVAFGCTGVKKTAYLDQNANFGAVQTVALLPMQNFTSDVNASQKVGQIVAIHLWKSRAFDLVEGGDVYAALAKAGVDDIKTMTAAQAQAVGEQLGAQALLTGTVRELEIDRSGGIAAPNVALQFDLLDAATGDKIWSTVVSRQGAGTGARLFGVGGRSVNETILGLVQEAFRTLID